LTITELTELLLKTAFSFSLICGESRGRPIKRRPQPRPLETNFYFYQYFNSTAAAMVLSHLVQLWDPVALVTIPTVAWNSRGPAAGLRWPENSACI
jgi:hypothetical protein